jgi:RNA polymerase sigma factor (sigma-70 family)
MRFSAPINRLPEAKAQVPVAAEVYWTPIKKVDFYPFDAKYLERLQNRDSDTETHFANYFGDRLRAKLLKRGFAIATVEDISQETFLRVLTAVRNETVRSPECFGGYVSSVCDMVVLEKYREHARHRHVDIDGLDLPDGKTSLETLVLRKENKEFVAGILAQLSVKNRNILRALIFEQADREELCARFHVTSDYLRVLLFRAREEFAALCKAKGRDHLKNSVN